MACVLSSIGELYPSASLESDQRGRSGGPVSHVDRIHTHQNLLKGRIIDPSRLIKGGWHSGIPGAPDNETEAEGSRRRLTP